MSKTLKILAVASLVALSTPAMADNNRSCAALIASSDGGGLVSFIIKASGARWWAQFFSRAGPCG